MPLRQETFKAPSFLLSWLFILAAILLFPTASFSEKSDVVALKSKVNIQIMGGKANPQLFSALEKGLKNQLPALKACSKNTIIRGKSVDGQIHFHFQINKKGKAEIKLEKNRFHQNKKLTSCILSSLKKIRFPLQTKPQISPKIILTFSSNLTKYQASKEPSTSNPKPLIFQKGKTKQNLPFIQSQSLEKFKIKITANHTENSQQLFKLQKAMTHQIPTIQTCEKRLSTPSSNEKPQFTIHFSVENKNLFLQLTLNTTSKTRFQKCILRHLKKIEITDLQDLSGKIEVQSI